MLVSSTVQCIDVDGTDELTLFNDEAQLARSAAGMLSIMRESIRPSQLLEMLEVNLNLSEAIHGLAIAFEPDSYPWVDGAVDPSGVRGGVPSDLKNSSLWDGQAQPWTLPMRRLWPSSNQSNQTAVLYCPYVARGRNRQIRMDLANYGYNYYSADREWYHAARTKFLNGELDFLEGVWGQPYFDPAFNHLQKVTFSVPFTRRAPVPSFEVPNDIETPYGFPANKVRQKNNVDHYFFGIAAVDIELSTIRFRCHKFSKMWDGEHCALCPEGTKFIHSENPDLANDPCQPCAENEWSVDDRSRCELNPFYHLYAFLYQLWLALAILPVGLRLQRNFYLLKAGSEEAGFVLHFCNKHGIHVRGAKEPTVRVIGANYRVLDHPNKQLRFKVFAEESIQILCDESERAELLDIKESSKLGGYARFGIVWELLHITVCCVPIVMWLVFGLVMMVGTLILWLFNNATALTVSLETAMAAAFWCLVVMVFRLLWQRSALRKQVKRQKLLNEKSLLEQLATSRWEANQTLEHEARTALLKVGWAENDIEEVIIDLLKRQSQEAGVGVSYLLSEAFQNLAQMRSNEDDPTFYTLKEKFFYGEDPIGGNIQCPRDGRLGCALVDTLARPYRRACTHYLSWTWKYSVSLVRDALNAWLLEMDLRKEECFLYMCFFVNNQYRILFEKDGVGSSNLEHVFEDTLTRAGRMVAILDDWHDPVYLTRIWTIFEQFTAIRMGNIAVTMVLPKAQNESLMHQIREGEEGIRYVSHCLCKFQSRLATAYSQEDEENVKAKITATIGFREVDRSIEQFMLNWVGNVVQSYMKTLMVHMGAGNSYSNLHLPALPGGMTITFAAPPEHPVEESKDTWFDFLSI